MVKKADGMSAFITRVLTARVKMLEPVPKVIHLRQEGEEVKMNLRGKYFTQRVGGIWNELPEKVEEVGTIIIVKRYLNRYLDSKVS